MGFLLRLLENSLEVAGKGGESGRVSDSLLASVFSFCFLFMINVASEPICLMGVLFSLYSTVLTDMSGLSAKVTVLFTIALVSSS